MAPLEAPGLPAPVMEHLVQVTELQVQVTELQVQVTELQVQDMEHPVQAMVHRILPTLAMEHRAQDMALRIPATTPRTTTTTSGVAEVAEE